MKPQVDDNKDNKSSILDQESLFVSLLKDQREDSFIILKFRNTFAISSIVGVYFPIEFIQFCNHGGVENDEIFFMYKQFYVNL